MSHLDKFGAATTDASGNKNPPRGNWKFQGAGAPTVADDPVNDVTTLTFPDATIVSKTVDSSSTAFLAGQAAMPKNGKLSRAVTGALSLGLTHAGIVLAPASAGQTVSIITQGFVDPTIVNLGAGLATAVGTDINGNPVRITDPACASGLKILGVCDVNGAIYVGPRFAREVNATDFGLVGDGSTANDAANAALIAFMTAFKVKAAYYPAGVYIFAHTIGPWPLGAKVYGDGLNGVVDTDGTVFKFTGNGLFIQLGFDAATETRSGGSFEHIAVIGGNTNGIASTITYTGSIVASASGKTWTRPSGSFITDGFQVGDEVYTSGFTSATANAYRHTIKTVTALVLTLNEVTDDETASVVLTTPHYCDVGLEVLNVGGVSVRNCRFGGFRFQVSLDGSEVCSVENCSFDDPATGGYPSGEMVTDNGLASAFAIRIGAFGSQTGIATNVNRVTRCQFNNTAWGIGHLGGIGNRVQDCNFETGIALIGQANFFTTYENITAEHSQNASFKVFNQSYDLRLIAISTQTNVPFLILTGQVNGLLLKDVDFFNWTSAFPITSSNHAVATSVVGCVAPQGAGSSTAGRIFDSAIAGGVVHMIRGDVVNGAFPNAIGIGSEPTAPLDVNTNGDASISKIRIRSAISPAPANSADTLGNTGDIAWDSGFIYVKTGTGAWKRAALSTF